jgi:pyruvate formate lyase activating enzyme
MSVGEVFAEIEKDKVFYGESGGGVTIGGGEVTVWPVFGAALMSRCREAGIGTAIETCGHTSWDKLWSVAQHADHVLYDVKHLDSAAHKRMTGAGNELILRNLAMLAKRHAGIVIRIPVIPGFNDDAETMRSIARHLVGRKVAARVELLPYQGLAVPKYVRLGKTYSLCDLEPPSTDLLESLGDVVRAEGLVCRIGG